MGRIAAAAFFRSFQDTYFIDARSRWMLCRRRHNVHYADLGIMPISWQDLQAAALWMAGRSA
jgi:hypothetical protein